MNKSLTASEVDAILVLAGVDSSALTISDDPAVWTNIETGENGTSVRIDGPEETRRAATAALWEARLSHAPYPDHDFWSR